MSQQKLVQKKCKNKFKKTKIIVQKTVKKKLRHFFIFLECQEQFGWKKTLFRKKSFWTRPDDRMFMPDKVSKSNWQNQSNSSKLEPDSTRFIQEQT